MSHRVGFYPGCARDLEGVGILEGLVDHVVLCDRNPRLELFWEREIRRRGIGDRCVFQVGDAWAVADSLPALHVVFHWRDSCEGSNITILRGSLLRIILERFPVSGGTFVTDGSNCWGNEMRRFLRPSGVVRHGWLLRAEDTQDLLESHGLWTIRATPVEV